MTHSFPSPGCRRGRRDACPVPWGPTGRN
jgi:hypothetical protein